MHLAILRAGFVIAGVLALESDAPTTWTATLRGVGPVRMGMTVAAAAQAVGSTGRVDADLTSSCDYAEIPGLPQPLSLMISDGRVVRYEVDGPGIRTASGAEVGMSKDSVLRLYAGHMHTAPDPYDGPDFPNLVYDPAPVDSQFGLIFQTDGHTIRGFRGGKRPQVEYIEGCS